MNKLDDDQKHKINVIISDHLNIDVENVKPESLLHEDLGADSIDKIELVMNLEKEFDINISDELTETVKNVGDIHTIIANLIY